MTAQPQPDSKARGRQRRIEGVVPERAVGGIVLVVIGVVIVVSRLVPGLEQYSLLAVGVTCLIAFLLTREYGYAVAAGITGGLGVGVVASAMATAPNDGVAFMLAFAGGFLAVWLLGLFADPPERNPWPLIPAAILAAIAISILTDSQNVIDALIIVVAVVLVLAGLRAFRGSRTETEHPA